MNKLMEQIMKFGVVGVVCFLIDFVITMVVSTLLRSGAGMDTGTAALIGAFFGFTISVIINYILSMRFVFVPKENISKDKSFVAFVILSLIGMLINSILLFVFIDILYGNVVFLRKVLSEESMNIIAKIFATVIVMVYNFITRKIFLEKKENI
jgi:putative flippase GtrA